MFQNKNGLFYSKHRESNQIELIKIDFDGNNTKQQLNQNKAVIIPLESKSTIIKYSFFDEALIVIQQNLISFYKNYHDKASKLTSPLNFVKEDNNSKVKLYQVNPLHLYIVSLGKTLHLMRIINEKRLIIQTFRLQSILIHSILSSDIHKEFSGDNISLTCRVAYDSNASDSFVIQSFILPFIESEIITIDNIFFGQSDPSSLIKIWMINTMIAIVYSKKGKKYVTTLNKSNNTLNKTFELMELNTCSIDQVSFVSSLNYLIFFSDNNKIFIYLMDTSNDIIFINRIDYNKEGKYLLKHKPLIDKSKVLIAAFNTTNKLKLITINKELNRIESEVYIMPAYQFDIEYKVRTKEFNREFAIKVIKEKHCEVMNAFFYNTIIQSINCIEGVTIIVYSTKIELFIGKDINKAPISTINYNPKDINILDYDICFIKDQLFFFILLIENNNNHSLLVLFQYNSHNQHRLTHLGNSSNASLLFNYSETENVVVRTLVNTSKIVSYISIIIDCYLLMLMSPYGEIEFYSFDEYGSIALLYHFTISLHSCEITEMKNEFENESDLNDIFRLDRKMHLLSSYCFIDAFPYNETAKDIPKERTLFTEKYIIIIVNFGIIVFQLVQNAYTGVRKIFFYDQINKAIQNHKIGFNRGSIVFDCKTKKFAIK